MGYSPWNSTKWDDHQTTVQTKTADQIFVKQAISLDLNPLNITVRESRDSDKHPESNPLIVACDESGSMGFIAEYFFKQGIGVLFEQILERQPIKYPQCMIMGIGDVRSDRSPVQVSQFESDTTILRWLEQVHVEGNGGGNNSESYDAAWYVAGNMTSIDSWEKRQKKGYLFTIGDEEAPSGMTRAQIKHFLGRDLPLFPDELVDDQDTSQMTDAQRQKYEAQKKAKQDRYVLSPQIMLESAQRMYNCYHIMVAQGDYASSYDHQVRSSWSKLLGERAIWLEDYQKMGEVIVSIIEVNEGRDKDAVAASWSGDTSLVVKSAIKDLAVGSQSNGKRVVRL